MARLLFAFCGFAVLLCFVFLFCFCFCFGCWGLGDGGGVLQLCLLVCKFGCLVCCLLLFDCGDESCDCAVVVPSPAVVVVFVFVWSQPDLFHFVEFFVEHCVVDVCGHGAFLPLSLNALWVMGMCSAKWYSMRCANAWISRCAFSFVRRLMKFMSERALTVQ